MPKHRSKQGKLNVAEAGQNAALEHKPFGVLGSATWLSGVESSSPESTPQDATSPPAHESTTKPRRARGRLVLRREKKGRGGKTVSVVAGLRADAHLAESEIAALAQDLKRELGCGGTIERVINDTELVLQGDRPARLAELLRARGFRVNGVTS